MSDEKSMHHTMMARDTASGAVKGGVVGALAGLAGKHPKSGAAAGAALGATLGGLRGRERVLKDKVKEQRMDDRYARRHPRLKAAAIEGFFDELEKLAVSEKWVFEKTMAAARKNPQKAARKAYELAGETGARSAKRGAQLRGLMAGQQHRAPGEVIERVVVRDRPDRSAPAKLLAAGTLGGVLGYHAGKSSKEKRAFLAPLATTVGTKAMQVGKGIAKATGQMDNWKGLLRQGAELSGKGNLARNVGYGVMGAGALGAGTMARSMMGGGQQ
jgi:hypothetical protein